MKKILIVIILILTSEISFSQTYLTSEVIEKAEVYLKQAVGESNLRNAENR